MSAEDESATATAEAPRRRRRRADPEDASASTNGTATAVAEKTETNYLVFQINGDSIEQGEQATFLGVYSGTDKAAARWAAIEDHGMEAVAQVEEGDEVGGVYLIAVSERMAVVERTYEEIVKTSRRH